MENSKELYERCWDILVEHAGCRNNPNDKEYFIYIATTHDRYNKLSEYRFQGLLGFGGKFWRNGGKLYISCYREDENKEIIRIMNTVNKLLKEITPAGGVWGPP